MDCERLKSFLMSDPFNNTASKSVSNGQDAPYLLYHKRCSTCWFMVRYTLVFA